MAYTEKFKYVITGRSANYPGETHYKGQVIAEDEKEAALLALANEFGETNKKKSPKQRLKGWIKIKDLNNQMKEWDEWAMEDGHFHLGNHEHDFFIDIEPA